MRMQLIKQILFVYIVFMTSIEDCLCWLLRSGRNKTKSLERVKLDRFDVFLMLNLVRSTLLLFQGNVKLDA